MASLGPRSYGRSILRGFVAELRHTGIFEEVRARASRDLALLLADPRRAPAWVPVAPLDEICALVAALRGREAVREMGYHTMSDGGLAAVLAPLIQVSLSLLGRSPAALFSRAQQLASAATRGVEIAWTPEGESGGRMQVRSEEVVPELSWAPWEGGLLYLCELGRARGSVAQAVPAADGRSCTIDVRWEQQR